MGRKTTSRTPASSAAAAAASSSIPAFTSFAAATAQALGAPTSTPVPHETTPWDVQALSILKKLSKRDSTTKLRALSDLSAHLHTLDDNLGSSVGAHFVTAWSAAFRPALLEEEIPAVRAALLGVMAEVVMAFRKLVQYVFADVLPVWVAARGDSSAVVAEMAVTSLDGVLTTEAQRAKVVERYGGELRKFCIEQIGALHGEGDGEFFLREVRMIVAVLRWLVEVGKSCEVVEEVVDAEGESLLTMARGGKKKDKEGRGGAMREVCEFAAVALEWMNVSVEKDRNRARRFVRVALFGVRRGESAAWDLLLVLLRGNWFDAFDWQKFEETLAEAVTATFPTGLSALLPVLDALPEGAQEAARLAGRVLERMRAALHPGGKGGAQVGRGNVGYVLTALPAYLECVSFTYSPGTKRWLQSDVAREEYAENLFRDHIVPTAFFFLAGELPPVLKGQSHTSNTVVRKSRGGGNIRVTRDVAMALTSTLKRLTKDQWNTLVHDLVRAFLDGLEANASEAMFRYELMLDFLKESIFATPLIVAMVRKIVDPKSKLTSDVGLAPLSLSLAHPTSRGVVQQYTDGADQLESLVQALLTYVNQTMAHMTDSKDGDAARETVKGAADVYSWIYWISSIKTLQAKQQDIVENIEKSIDGAEQWCVLGEVLRAHKRRKDVELFFPWNMIRSNRLEVHILNATESLKANENMVHALTLISAAGEPECEAHIPMPVLRKIADVVTVRLMNDESDSSCDEVIMALLQFPVQCLESEEAFHKLFAWAILRASMNGAVLLPMLALLDRCPPRKAVSHVKEMLDVLRKNDLSPRSVNEPHRGRSARIAARIISHLHKEMGVDCVVLCESIMSWCSTDFAKEFLRNIPMTAAFGGEESHRFRQDRLLDVFEVLGKAKEFGDVFTLLCDFLISLSAEEKGMVARSSAKRFLVGSHESIVHILGVLFHNPTQDDQTVSIASQLIADVVADSIVSTKATSNARGFERVPLLMTILVTESHGSCLEAFNSFFHDIARMVRRDPLAKNAGTAFDIVSASLLDLGTRSKNADSVPIAYNIPQWLKDNVLVALMSARKCLERPLSASSDDLHNLEAHSSYLMSCAIKAIGVESIGKDEFRFWALRAKDVFQFYVERGLDEGEQIAKVARRLSSLAALGSALVDFDEPTKLLQPGLIQELCHFGAWASVGLLPVMEVQGSDGIVDGNALKITAEGACDLVLKAAEKGVLVSPDGRIPVEAALVYELAPLLSSPSASTRKAVLALLVFTATIELPKTVSGAFSGDGFGDEAEELAFVTGLIPMPLRKALEWPAIVAEDTDADGSGDAATQELGYFLSWRLFLDLICDSVAGSAMLRDTQEDFSFRRVGTTYLRSQPDLYATFFNKCVEVIVDGNPREKIAAGAAAAEALEAEERVAQGIQLVKEQIEQEEKEQKHNTAERDADQPAVASEMELTDEQVGHAAGIAFARALQRLPALSRQHVTDKLDRGTALRLEEFVRKKISPLLIAAEIRKVKEWGAFGGGAPVGGGGSSTGENGEGELQAQGSVAGRLVWATYTFSDVTLEIGMRLPDAFPLHTVEVEARSRIGMSESRWRKTLLGMMTLLRAKDGTLAEAVELWRRNLDKTFQGAEECPICYSVLHLATAALPRMQCRTCHNLFHSECLCKWFTKSNSSACPLCRSAF